MSSPASSSQRHDDTPRADYAALRRLYARYAPNYDRRFARYSDATLRHAMQAIGDTPPGHLVDVACGTGLLIERVRLRWPATPSIGVDLSPDMLEQADRRLPTSDGSVSPSTSWRVGPAEDLPIDDASADTLTCTNAFHLVQRPTDALAEFRRVLRPHGRLIIVDWCADYRSMRLLLAALPILLHQRRHPWTLERLRAAMETAGFVVTSAERFKVGPIWGLMTLVATRP